MIGINIKQIIKEYFFNNPTSKLRVRQIERKLNLSFPSVIFYCKKLKNEDILKTVEISGIVFYTANITNQNYLLEKKFYNIKNLYNSNVINYIKNELSNPLIIVFGSYSKGEDIENSDIDLYIETPSKKEINLEKYKKTLKRTIQLFVHKNINEIKNKELKNNIVNGYVLNKFLEVFKWTIGKNV